MQTDTGINRFSTFYKIVSISLAYTPQGLLAKVRDYKIRNVKQRRSIWKTLVFIIFVFTKRWRLARIPDTCMKV